MHVIQAEVADRFVTRMTGLMHRPELAPNAGMLCVFEERDKQCMWMKNTLIPLSVAYLGEDGTIINIADMRPHDETSHCAKSPVRFALEMNQGWFAARGLKPGARLQGLERLMIETDAPFLTPMPHRGKPNEPAYLRHTADYCAEMFGVSPERLAAVTTQNARSFFRLGA
jgi:uncharacterized membrane protein (UPF0127 family)